MCGCWICDCGVGLSSAGNDKVDSRAPLCNILEVTKEALKCSLASFYLGGLS